MSDIEVIRSTQRTDDKGEVFYSVGSPRERDSLINVFKNVFENNWGVYARRIKII